MTTRWSRRGFLARSAGAFGAWLTARGTKRALAQTAGSHATRLVLLGTAGGPTPKATRSAPAQVILFNGAAYVIDCGNGVARQLRLAQVALRDIRHVLLTHHHSDHNADYGTLLLLAWATDLAHPVDTWGPPPLARITRLFLDMSETDIEVRRADEGRQPLAPLVRPHEITGPPSLGSSPASFGEASAGAELFRDGALTVTFARVSHPLIKDAFAYRFDTPDRSIVISGDTARSPALVKLARNADVLVHEALYTPAIETLTRNEPNAATLRKHLADSHTPVEEVGRIAAEANVKTLVLSHLVPGETTAVPDEEWQQAAQKHFTGKVVVGRDLMEI